MNRATGVITGGQVETISSGLEQLSEWTASIDGSLPAGDESAGALVHRTLENGLATVEQYLNTSNVPTIEGLTDVLSGLSGTYLDGTLSVNVDNINVVASGTTTRWDIDFQSTLDGTTTLGNIGDSRNVRGLSLIHI